MTPFPFRLTTGLVALAACFTLNSCESTKKADSGDFAEVDYTDSSSRKTDAERAARPFDDAGNYREDWVAKGEGASGVRDTPTSAAYTQDADDTPVSPRTVASSGSSGTKKSSSSSSGSGTRKSTASSKPKPKPKPVAKPTYVKVKPGDTLYGLALKNGTTVAAIKSANGLKSDTIVDGKSLKIPKKK